MQNNTPYQTHIFWVIDSKSIEFDKKNEKKKWVTKY